MAEEKDLNEQLQKKDIENKKKFWKKLSAKLEDQSVDLSCKYTEKRHVVKSFWSKVISIVATCLLVAVGILLSILLVNHNKNEVRYCTVANCVVEDATVSIEQYSKQNNLGLLYFTNETIEEICLSQHYKLKSSNEIICLYEESIDANGSFIYFYVTDNKTELDLLTNHSAMCTKTQSVLNVDVNFGTDLYSSYATFEKNGHNYYVKVTGSLTENYILELMEDLLSKAS